MWLEHGLHEGVEAGGGFVEKQEFDVGGHRLPVSLRVGAAPAVRVELEAFDELLTAPRVRAAAQARKEVDRLAAGECGSQFHVAGHIGETVVEFDGRARYRYPPAGSPAARGWRSIFPPRSGPGSRALHLR
ncbi:hypothetical protein GCM10027595_10270 [Corynebacterium nasicanis]